MKRKIILLLIITFGILLIPKNGFAKTLEINLPSNSINYSQGNGMLQYYSAREMYVMELLTDYFCNDARSTLNDMDNGYSGIFPFNHLSILKEETGNIPSDGFNTRDGSRSVYVCNLRNLDNNKEIIKYEAGQNYVKYQLLSNVSDDDLFFSITDDIRYFYSPDDAFMLYGYDSIRFNLKEMEFIENTDIVYDFTKYNDLYDMSFYDNEILFMIFDYFSHIGEDSNFPVVVPENYEDDSLYYVFSDRNGKELFRFYSDDTNNSNLRFKIVLADEVSYKDNFTYVLPSDLKNLLASEGFYVNSISFRFGDEPKEEPIVEKVKNIVTNPKTYNGMFIVFIVLICSIGGFGLYKKINNN